MEQHRQQYTLTKPLGRGGMGQVWAALKHGEAGMQMPCAIKVLWPALAMTEEDRERFYGEARIAAQLDHGRIVKVIDTATVQGSPSLIMEWVDGVNLRELIERARGEDIPRLGVGVSLYIVGELLAALAYAHGRTVAGEQAGIIHSDVTPGNILISSSGEVKLTDFGIARFARTTERTMSRAIGTPRYMAPEQLRGRVSTATDIYALGVVLHELLDGERFFHDCASEQFQGKVLAGEIPPLRQTDVPEWVDALRRQMLSLDPGARPRAEDALATIIARASNYAQAALELKRLYQRCVGASSSGLTELVSASQGGAYGGFGVGQALPEVVTGAVTRARDDAATRPAAPVGRPAAPVGRPAAPVAVGLLGRLSLGGDDEGGTGAVTAARTRTAGPHPPVPDEAPTERTILLAAEDDEGATTPMPPARPLRSRPVPSLGAPGSSPPVSSAPARGPRVVVGGPAMALEPRVDAQAIEIGRRKRLRTLAGVAGGLGAVFAGLFAVALARMWRASDPAEPAQPSEAVVVADVARSGPVPALVAPAPVDSPAEPPEPPVDTPTPALEPMPEPEPDVEAAPELEPEPEPEPPLASKPKAKTKAKAKPAAVTVSLLIVAKPPGGSKAAEFKVAGRQYTTDNGFRSVKLRPGKHPIAWRWGASGSWHELGSLTVAANLPTGSYYSAKLQTGSMQVEEHRKENHP